MTAWRLFRQVPWFVAFICLSSTSAFAQTASFGAATLYTTGVNTDTTTGVALADLNHDGKPDLIVSNCGCNGTTIRVRLNNGDGTFGAPTDYTVDVAGYQDAYTVVTGDFNNDGNMDVATVKSYDNLVVVLLGNGDGTLQHERLFDTGPSPYRVIAVDIDGDSNLDLVTANQDDDTITVLLGDGTGNFVEAPNSPFATGESGGTPTGVAAADLNGDGFIDLVVSNGDAETFTVFLSDGAGNFVPSSVAVDESETPAGPADVALVDVDGDNVLDIVGPGVYLGGLLIFHGNGDGTFTEVPPLEAGFFPTEVRTGDLNNDGRADVALANSGDNSIAVFQANGSGLDAALFFDNGASGGPVALAIGDADGDLRLDLATANFAGDDDADASVLLGNMCCTVSVALAGTGTGVVSSGDGHISCNPSCRAWEPPSGPVTLSALPDSGLIFTGWSGACTGTGACILPAGSDAAVTATFDTLLLDPSPFPAGSVGAFYVATATATNGTGPYAFSLESGTLPSGLVLGGDGTISGTPDTNGTFNFTLAATDSNGIAGTRAYSITITAAATSTIAFATDALYSDSAQEVELSAGVSSLIDVNSGTVTFTVRDGSNAIVGSPTTSGPVTEGVAAATYTLPGGTLPQTLTITAVYNANPSFQTSSGSDALTISAAPSATSPAGASTPFSVSSHAVPLSANVTSSGGIVNSGTVTFTVRDSGSAVVGAPVVSGPVSGGLATASYTLPAGTMAQTLTITADFSGSTTFTGSTGLASLMVTCPAIDIVPAALPPLRLGHAFTVTFSTPSFSDATFSLIGSVPGLSLSGATLSGTPTSLGRFTIGIKASSASTGGCPGSRSFALDVMRPPFFVAGAGAGSPVVRGFDEAATLTHNFFADDPAFAGGVRVALGDLTGDGVPDIITAPGPGASAATVHVFDGASGVELRRFDAFAQAQPGGLYVAAGDVNSDGVADIIVGSDGSLPEVRIFDGRSNVTLADFLAYPSSVPGVRVAAGDVDGDGVPEIIVAPPPGSAPEVRVFGADGVQRAAFFAYAPAFTGGVYVAAGDIDGDGLADIVTGADAGGGPHVIAFSGADGHVLRSFYAYSPFFFGGVRVAVGDLDLDGYAEIITAAGPGGGPHVRVFDGATGDETTGFYAFDATFAGGVFVAAPPPQSRMAIDLPSSGATLPSVFMVSGWAAEGLAVTDNGIDGVHVWALPVGSGPYVPIFVGATTVGVPRPDVAALFGGIYADSGFNLLAGPLPAGTYDLAIYVHSSRTGTFIDRRVVRIVITP